jgi:exoribonuclease R
MLASKSFNKLTRRGKLLRVLREHYLRDDIPCGVGGCASCAGADAASGAVVTAASAAGPAAASQTWLSPEPRDGVVVVPDTNIMLHQMDVLEAAGDALTDVLVLQTVLGETRHRHMGSYGRLLALLRDSSRRFVPFGNEHHSETYSDRRPGESANDYCDRLVRRAAAWLADHLRPLGLSVLLLTDDAASGRLAAQEHGLRVATMRQFIHARAAAAATAGVGGGASGSAGAAAAAASGGAQPAPLVPFRGALDVSKLADLVATVDDDDDETLSLAAGAVSVGGGGSASVTSGISAAAAASSSSSSAASVAARGQPARTAGGAAARRLGGKAVAGSLYREHWAPSRVASALQARSAFQGTLRVNRECWYEARVAVHGVLSGKARSEGERLAAGGGEDVISVLISGREAINRAMEGDSVVIQLLPRSQWRSPSSKLAEREASSSAAGAVAEDADAEAAVDAAAGGEEVVGTAARVAGGDDAPGGGGSSGGGMALDDADAAAADAADAIDDDGDGDACGRDVGHDAAVAELRRAAAKVAAAGGAPSGGGSAAGGGGGGGPVPNAAIGLPGGVVPTGRVVGVVKRAWRHYCGSLQPEPELAAVAAGGIVGQDGGAATAAALFVPVDPKIPRIKLDTRQKGGLMDKRIVVAIDGWAAHERYPRGHYVRTIGAIGERAAETEVILLEHDIPFRPFSADVLACLPPADWAITPANSAGRTDLRGLPVCSVDPPGCKDIDDALHARWVLDPDTGRPAVEVGVHIADVSYFVRPGTPIDLEAAARSNTTYLVERRLDMLPGLLTETLCSLKGGVDRFAFSVTWLFVPSAPAAGGGGAAAAGDDAADPSAGLPRDAMNILACGWAIKPGSARYFKSIIHSHAAMTYGMAQALLDVPATPTPVASGIKLLASIARALRAGRKEAGALTLGSAEVRFQLDSETHDPIDVAAYEHKETNSMVEEFMLLANVWTAKRTAEQFPRYAMLRRHPAPPRAQFDSLLAAAAAVGVVMRVDSSKALADSLDDACVAGNPYVNKLLRILATRCMAQAVYFPSGEVSVPEYAHYGLAAPIYTHFTSPIRRYSDVIVHRLLACAIEVDPLPVEYEDLAGMRKLCDNMNRRHLMAQLAGRASGSLHTNLFFKQRVVVESGLVMRVRANGVALLVPRFGLECVVILGRAAGEQRAAGGGGGGGLGLLKPGFTGVDGAARRETRVLAYDEERQTLRDATPDAEGGAAGGGGAERVLTIFDEVRVALCVEERASFRKELVVRIIDPPFHALHTPHGFTVEDATGGRPLASASVAAKAAAHAQRAAAAVGGGGGAKKQAREASGGSGGGGGDGGPAGPAAKKAKTAPV